MKNLQIIQSKLDEANAKIIEKNKMIDLMASYIANLDIVEKDTCDKMNSVECEDCIKQYFERKVRSDSFA